MYVEGKKLKNIEFFNYFDDGLRGILNSIKKVKKESGEGIFSLVNYLGKNIKDTINENAFSDLEIFKSKKSFKNEIFDLKEALENLFKFIKFIFIFILYGILDFIIDLIKMPFYVLMKTFYVLFSSLSLILNKFK